jgi:hypothetical protein
VRSGRFRSTAGLCGHCHSGRKLVTAANSATISTQYSSPIGGRQAWTGVRPLPRLPHRREPPAARRVIRRLRCAWRRDVTYEHRRTSTASRSWTTSSRMTCGGQPAAVPRRWESSPPRPTRSTTRSPGAGGLRITSPTWTCISPPGRPRGGDEACSTPLATPVILRRVGLLPLECVLVHRTRQELLRVGSWDAAQRHPRVTTTCP